MRTQVILVKICKNIYICKETFKINTNINVWKKFTQIEVCK